MPWVKLDDKFHMHPKVLMAGNEAAGLYARALSYCGDLLTDGFVPAQWVKINGGTRLGKKVTDAGLWNEVPGGFIIPDYLAMNPSSESVESRREQDRIRKESARNRRGNQGESVLPVPEPDPKEKNPSAVSETSYQQHRKVDIPNLRDVA